jgi:hypothetical protein
MVWNAGKTNALLLKLDSALKEMRNLGMEKPETWGLKPGDRRDVHRFFGDVSNANKMGYVPSVPTFRTLLVWFFTT